MYITSGCLDLGEGTSLFPGKLQASREFSLKIHKNGNSSQHGDLSMYFYISLSLENADKCQAKLHSAYFLTLVSNLLCHYC